MSQNVTTTYETDLLRPGRYKTSEGDLLSRNKTRAADYLRPVM